LKVEGSANSRQQAAGGDSAASATRHSPSATRHLPSATRHSPSATRGLSLRAIHKFLPWFTALRLPDEPVIDAVCEALGVDWQAFLAENQPYLTTGQVRQMRAEGHLKALDGVGSTAENLQTAIDGETYEFTEMYPPMLEQAEADGHKAKRMFKYAVEAEQVHAKLYKMALEAVQNGQDLTEEFYLCPVCGYIEMGAPPEKCPVCGLKGEKFVQI